MNNAQKPCSHCSRATGGEYKYMTLAVVHPCCFVHNKQDNASPASLGERKRSITQLRRRGGVEILLCSTSSTVRTQQSQKCAKNNILHTHHKTDGDVEEERESAWHWLRSASQSNYILILWKLHKCWPLGKFHGSRSHCIECVLLLLLYQVLRLVGGCDKGPVCLQFLFQLLLLVADVSHLCGLNLSDKGGARLPLGTSFIHVSDLFLLPWPLRIHIAFIRVVEEEGEWGWGVWMSHCGTWVLQWKLSFSYRPSFFSKE